MVRMRSPVQFRLGALHLRPVGQVVKTPPFHGGNRGSSPLRVIVEKVDKQECLSLLLGITKRMLCWHLGNDLRWGLAKR
jgi:hypothetical protein